MKTFTQKLIAFLFVSLLAHVSFAQDTEANIIFEAIEKNNYDKVKTILENNGDANVQDALRNTPMHMAAFWGRERIIDLLVSHGGKVDAINEAGRSPLYSAVEADHPSAVKALLKNGADVNARYQRDRMTVLHLAALDGHFETAEALLEGGANPKIKDAAGKRPVNYAKAQKDKILVKLLKDKRWR